MTATGRLTYTYQFESEVELIPLPGERLTQRLREVVESFDYTTPADTVFAEDFASEVWQDAIYAQWACGEGSPVGYHLGYHHHPDGAVGVIVNDEGPEQGWWSEFDTGGARYEYVGYVNTKVTIVPGLEP